MKTIPEEVVDAIARKLRDHEAERTTFGEFDGEPFAYTLDHSEATELARDLIGDICKAVLDGAPKLEIHPTGKHCPQDRAQFERLDLGVYGLVYLGEADG